MGELMQYNYRRREEAPYKYFYYESKGNKMKSFKDFVINKTSKLPSLETIFGSHSDQKPTKRTKVSEDTDMRMSLGKNQLGEHSPEEEDEIHDENKINAMGSEETIGSYTNDSTWFNKTLHRHYLEHGREPMTGKSGLFNDVKPLDNALNASTIKRGTHVFTGIKRNPADLFAQAGKTDDPVTTHHPAYLSTSTNFESAIQFSKAMPHDLQKHPALNSDHASQEEISNNYDEGPHHILKLHVPTGTHGGSVRHISQGEGANENEVLLHRGHTIQIDPRPTIVPHPWIDGEHVAVWHARVVGHDPIEYKE
jgi:hypothetical protein